jgi:hypothetical protein
VDTVAPFSLAEIVTDFDDFTCVVVIANVAVACPAATVTLEGNDAKDGWADNTTTIPAAGAAPFSVTVPVEDAPPVTLVGLTDNTVTDKGFTVSVAVLLVTLAAVLLTTTSNVDPSSPATVGGVV